MSKLDESIEKYFNDKQKEISKKIDPNKNYIYRLQQDDSGNFYIELYDNDKLVLKAEYELIGIYNMFNSIWYWAHNIQFINRHLAKESKKIKEFSKELKDNYEKYDPIEADTYYYISKNGNFYTSSDNVIKMIKLMLYVCKGLWYIPVCAGKDNVTCTINKNKSSIKRMEYLIIKKINI